MDIIEKTVKKFGFFNEIFRISASKDIEINQLFETVAQSALHYAKTLEVNEDTSKNENEALKENHEEKSSCCT
jgi:GTPase SAR1 family protein